MCGAEAPADSLRCPSCGAPFLDEPEIDLRPRRAWRIPWLAILVTLALVAVAVLLWVMTRA